MKLIRPENGSIVKLTSKFDDSTLYVEVDEGTDWESFTNPANYTVEGVVHPTALQPPVKEVPEPVDEYLIEELVDGSFHEAHINNGGNWGYSDWASLLAAVQARGNVLRRAGKLL